MSSIRWSTGASDDGSRLLASLGYDNTMRVYRVSSAAQSIELVHARTFREQPSALSWLSNQRLIVSIRGDCFLHCHQITPEQDPSAAMGTSTVTFAKFGTAPVAQINLNSLGDTHVSFNVLHMQRFDRMLALVTDKHRIIVIAIPSDLMTTVGVAEFQSLIGKQLYNFYDLQSDGYRLVLAKSIV